MATPLPPPLPQQQHRVAVAGAGGRMGRMLIEAVAAADDCVLAGALEQAGCVKQRRLT